MCSNRLLFIGAALALLFLLEIALMTGILAVHSHGGRGLRRNEVWQAAGVKARPGPSFVWTFTLLRAPGPGEAFRSIVDSEAGRTEVLCDGRGVRLAHVPALEPPAGHAAGRWPHALNAGETVRIVRERGRIGVYLDDVRVCGGSVPPARVLATRAELGAPRGNASQPPAGVPAPLARCSFQKTAPICFADDFMHGKDELGQWRVVRGTWHVSALEYPIRSANAFSFWGSGPEALAVAGYWFWRDYSAAVSVHPLAPKSFGVVLDRSENGDGYRLEWRATQGHAPGRLRLLRFRSGNCRTLAAVPLGFVSKQWYRLEFSAFEGQLRAKIDDSLVLKALDPHPLFGGGFGLWSRGGDGVVFDDVEVRPARTVFWNPAQADTPWFVQWTPPAPSAAGSASGRTLRFFAPVLEDPQVRVEFAGLHHLQAPLTLLIRRGAGDARVLARIDPGENPAGGRLEETGGRGAGHSVPFSLPNLSDRAAFGLHIQGPKAWFTVNGGIAAVLGELTNTGPAIPLIRSGGARVLQAALAVQTPMAPIENRVQTFSYEESMRAWGDPESEWRSFPWKQRETWWHRTDFWGDFSVTLDHDLLPGKPRRWGLLLAAGDPGEGKILAVSVEPDSSGKAAKIVVAPFEGAPVSKGGLPRVRTLTLERRDRRILVWAGDRLLRQGPAGGALAGLIRIGRFGGRPSRQWAGAVRIGARGVRTYSFKRAPADWIPAAGSWRVTNRWQCDPRWSFFSGVQLGGPACLWNKRRFGRNISVEFFAGPKMDRARGRSEFDYAADLDAVICADGRDVTSGYSFMFGGWKNSGAYIVRGRKVLARNRAAIISRRSLHRRWFYIKIRKRGPRLTLWIDGEKVCTAVDPQPLDGRRFGLWTWNNGMMVAQVRVSSSADLPPDRPLTEPPPKPRTPYNP